MSLLRTFTALSLLATLTACVSVSTDDHEMSMSMDEMTHSLQDKTGDDFDKAFIETMIPHHEGAIHMAELAKKNAKHEAIRTLADEIIKAQQQEIDLMNQWKEAWGY